MDRGKRHADWNAGFGEKYGGRTDLVIQQQEGALLQEILDEKGVPYFLDAEERAVRSVACDRHVIAPGGSVVCREGAIAHLKAEGPVIYLRVPLEELKARIHNLDSRGIALEPGQTLEDIMDLRAPLYERYADAVVDAVPGQSTAQTVSSVLERLEQLVPGLTWHAPSPQLPHPGEGHPPRPGRAGRAGLRPDGHRQDLRLCRAHFTAPERLQGPGTPPAGPDPHPHSGAGHSD